jgi:hypothetical protein
MVGGSVKSFLCPSSNEIKTPDTLHSLLEGYFHCISCDVRPNRLVFFFKLICAVGLWVLRPLLAYYSSPG